MKASICQKIIDTINYMVVPVAGAAAIWGLDITIYTAAAASALSSMFTFVKLFLKD